MRVCDHSDGIGRTIDSATTLPCSSRSTSTGNPSNARSDTSGSAIAQRHHAEHSCFGPWNSET